MRLLLARVRLDVAALRDALPQYLADIGRNAADARELFAPGAWWDLKLSAGRWLDFVRENRDLGAPADLADVASGVAQHLLPLLASAT